MAYTAQDEMCLGGVLDPCSVCDFCLHMVVKLTSCPGYDWDRDGAQLRYLPGDIFTFETYPFNILINRSCNSGNPVNIIVSAKYSEMFFP